MSKATTIRWGIMATGGIAKTFTKDLLIDPTTRGTNDIVHQVAAVASSSNVDSAKKFISEIVGPKQSSTCSAYGSYDELVKDKSVDIVYVATPHSHHFQNCMLALTNNKPVLCEKALTVNAEQARILFKTAKERNLFFMEAVWTRYFPLSIFVRKSIQDGLIGEVHRVSADLSPPGNPDKFDLSNRMVNLDLAGGALLDLGIYSLTWVFQTLYHTIPPSERQPPSSISTAMSLFPPTKADADTTILLSFPRSVPSGTTSSHAVASTSLGLSHDPTGSASPSTTPPAVRIQGTLGEIQVFPPIFRPTKIRILRRTDSHVPNPPSSSSTAVEEKTFDFPAGGHGMFYEADEAARCLRDGKLESEGMGWKESEVIMDVMDTARKQGGLKYPKEIESTEFPVDLKAKGL